MHLKTKDLKCQSARKELELKNKENKEKLE